MTLIVVEDYVQIEIRSVSDLKSNLPFLRNEFAKTSKKLFTITLFPNMTHFYETKRK